MKEALASAARNDSCQQYPHPSGSPLLRRAIADNYSNRVGFHIQPDSNVLVTVGASQALSLACMTLLQPGDEVVLFEPAFDIYSGAAVMAGATTRGVPFRVRGDGNATTASQLHIDLNEFRNALNQNTRMLILNSPHNPTGKVFTRDELEDIARIIDENCPQCVVLSDEVYEHLVFDCSHIPFASVSETARNRTLSVYSCGKTFSSTGWKIGWIIGHNPHFMNLLKIAQQYTVFSVCSTSQNAVSQALSIANEPYCGFDNYYLWLCAHYRELRDLLVDTLKNVGMNVIVPDGAFYVLASPGEGELRNTRLPEQYQRWMDDGVLNIDPSTVNRDDYNICRNLTVTHGVAAIPPSAFFSPDNLNAPLAKNFARFAFCKPRDVILQARISLVRGDERAKGKEGDNSNSMR